MMNRRTAALALSAAFLAACANLPWGRRDLSADQVARLQAAGFTPAPGGGWEYLINGRILFGTDVDTLDAESLRVVSRLAPMLESLGVAGVRVEGHADIVGPDAYNVALSLRRAQAVASALQAQGMSSVAIQVQGYGNQRPIADNSSSEGRAQNRRVAIIVPGP